MTRTEARNPIRAGIWLMVLFVGAATSAAQIPSDPGSQGGFRLQLPVDEVVVTFHAEDAQGLPVNDLKQGEVKLLDNGTAPRRIVAFDGVADRALHAGILLDTSESMFRFLGVDRAIAEQFARTEFRARSDEGFVMDFGYGSEIAQDPTSDPALLSRGIAGAPAGNMNALGGTALFAAVFRACFYEFGQPGPEATGNALLLLSDGEDTAGRTTMDEAVRACQRNNIAIYAFRPRSGRHFSTGPRTLAELTQLTGGRVFVADGAADGIESDLKTIESETRNQYRLVYAPAGFLHDGTFHRIELQLPDRVKQFRVRSGYYAPVK